MNKSIREDKHCRISLGCGIWSKGSRVVAAGLGVGWREKLPHQRKGLQFGRGKEKNSGGGRC